MNKTLVWITHSFRLDSRLTNRLTGPCTFVYYSPYYFAGERERLILKRCSKQNLDAFYESLDTFDQNLKSKNNRLYVFKNSNPVEHMNYLCSKYGFDKIVIDQPMFAMWHTIDLLKLNVPYEFVDSDLIDDKCTKMTAKSRWMSHTKNIEAEFPFYWNENITRFSIDEPTQTYPKYERNWLIDPKTIQTRALAIAPTYGQTRDKHFGQTRLSTAIQNGTVDAHNVFYEMANQFKKAGADFSINDGAHASMLRQFAFREINIIYARRANMTMENAPMEWLEEFITDASLQNLLTQVNTESRLTFKQIREANTGDELVDQILQESYRVGVMPNRARMFFAGWLFYNAPTGLLAIQWLINVFDLLLLDGQCPNNYLQCVAAMNLQYGKVMLLNRNRVKELLNYDNI